MLSCRSPSILVLIALGGACNTPRIIPTRDAGPGASDAAARGLAPVVVPLPPALPAADAAACLRVTCTPAGGQYCGDIGDGCSGTLSCGDCPAGSSCGGGGVPHLCGQPADPACQPIACDQPGGRLCGRVGDGCGRPLECGDCPGGTACPASNVCAGGAASADGGAAAVCENLCKQQQSCPAGSQTTVSGTVYAPTRATFGAADPLYNAVVYVPNAPVAPFAPGVACEKCGRLSGAPLVAALTGPDGTFTLRNVPAGARIPLVVQIGRWRRQVTIPQVTPCQDNPLPAELTRLPRNRAEGDIPAMAIATGEWDSMECLLRKVGIDDAEFTLPTGPGRVHLWKYGGNDVGANTPNGDDLTASLPTMSKYDIVVLPCDSEEAKAAGRQQALEKYSAGGGRIFLTDFSFSWLQDGAASPFHTTLVWKAKTVPQGPDFTTTVDQSFPKGLAFARWLHVVGASPTLGQLPIHDPYHGWSNVEAVVPPTQRWLYTEAPPQPQPEGAPSVQHLTFNTPVGVPAEQQCGRVTFSQFHVAAEGKGVDDGAPPPHGRFPATCSNKPMTPQEKALEFMLFDASSCIQPDTEPPRIFQPPPPAPPPAPPLIP
jgi:hypothetical protein